MTTTDTSELVEQAQDGDFAAFEQLVNEYEGLLYGLALKILKKPADAEDVVQNSFMKAMDKLSDLREPRAFGAWLKRIATNNALQILRRRRGLPMVSLDAATEPDEDGRIPNPEYIAEWSQDPAELAHRRDIRSLLGQALDEIPDSYRWVFVLRDIHGLSTRETANALEISQANVKVRLLRARLALREKLTKVLGDPQRLMHSTHDHGGSADADSLLNLYRSELQEVHT